MRDKGQVFPEWYIRVVQCGGLQERDSCHDGQESKMSSEIVQHQQTISSLTQFVVAKE